MHPASLSRHHYAPGIDGPSYPAKDLVIYRGHSHGSPTSQPLEHPKDGQEEPSRDNKSLDLHARFTVDGQGGIQKLWGAYRRSFAFRLSGVLSPWNGPACTARPWVESFCCTQVSEYDSICVTVIKFLYTSLGGRALRKVPSLCRHLHRREALHFDRPELVQTVPALGVQVG